MKIIELLNKIANGEIPKTIVYDERYFTYDDKRQNYFTYDDSEIDWKYTVMEYINDEIEIIEDAPKEEKKIPEKLDIRQEKNIKNNWKWKVYGKEHSYNISTPQKIIADKLNEVIDYLKSKGEENEI